MNPSSFAGTIFNAAQHYASTAYWETLTALNMVGKMPNVSTNIPTPDITITQVNLFPHIPLPADIAISTAIPLDIPQQPDLTPRAYNDPFINIIKQWFLTRLTLGGTGIVRQQDIYNLENARMASILQDGKTRMLATQVPWNYPAGCLNAVLNRFDFDYGVEFLDINRERAINTEKYTIAQQEYALTSGTDLEKVLMMYWPEMAKAMAYMFDAEVQAYDAEVQGFIGQVSIAIAQYEAIITGYEAQTTIYQSAASNYNKLVGSESSAIQKQATLAIMEIDAQVKAVIRLAEEHVQTLLEVSHSGAQMCAGAMASAHAQASLATDQDITQSSIYDYSESEDSSLYITLTES